MGSFSYPIQIRSSNIYILVSRLSLIYIFNEKYKQYYIDYNMSPIVLYQTNCAVELLWELHFYTKLF